ncbi:methyltransferase [Mariprofundus sp. NF]|uniref:TylF/MycF/NovP-related O-methyltransferase n=1 Tax=Mariprofundus sp. NF TaxID=2608716 RepID=UPI0015A1657E|nr:TylF/MycF/NovP-related O-methyltransferase [Mariprofundus sp. NF]NWF39501.1 methyltransferase [Mariprofundus sp. NF]
MNIFNAAKILIKALRGDDESRYYLAERSANFLYPKLHVGDRTEIWREDAEFLKWYERYCGSNNYRSLDRKYTIRELLKLVEGVAGDTVECGAYQGATSYLICQHAESFSKMHCLFDSFEGLSSPGENDGSYWQAADLISPEAACRETLQSFSNVMYYKGWIPDKFGEVKSGSFSFLHIDVDLYQPTLDALEFFYPRMASGGVIVCDDYGFGTCPGTKLAMDEYFGGKEKILSLTTGQGVVIKL